MFGRPAASLAARALHAGAVIVPVGVVPLATSEFNPRILVGAATVAIFWSAALRRSYWGTRISALVQGVGTVSAISLGMGLTGLALLGFWLPRIEVGSSSRLILAAGVVLAAASLEMSATSFESRRRVLVVGTADEGTELRRNLALHPGRRFDCVGIVEDGYVNPHADGLHRGTLRELGQVVTLARPDLIVLSEGPARAEAVRQLMDTHPADFRLIGLHQFYEHAFGRVPVEHLSPVWFMSVLHLYQRTYSRLTKRIFDLALASVALAIVAPGLLILAVLVRLSSPGPVIFRQIRLGEGGTTFVMLKFRTMVNSAEGDGGAMWATERDPRGTRVGGFMRSTRLDELPQLWNVVRGEMSLVGPRPERPEFLTLLRREVPFWTSRHLVKPGITGWAQISVGAVSGAGGATEKLSYDLYYLKHRSVATDLAILAKTARVVPQGLLAHYRHHVEPDVGASNVCALAPRAESLLVGTASADASHVPAADPASSS